MMKLRLLLAIALLSFGCRDQVSVRYLPNTPRLATVPRGDIFFDCDGPPGASPTWSQSIGGTGSAAGSMFIAGVRSHSWAVPSAIVGVVGEDERQRASVTFAVNDDENALVPTVRYSVPIAKGIGIMKLPFKPLPLSAIAFDVQWAPNLVRVRFERGAPWIDIPVAFAPTRFELQCTTAEAVFSSVRIER